jgi:hypothetical protein
MPSKAGEERRKDLFLRLAGLRWLSDHPSGAELAVTPRGTSNVLPYLGHPLSNFQAETAKVLATDLDGNAVVASNALGSGTVFFTSDASPDGTRRALEAFLGLRRVQGTRISPKRESRPMIELDRADGGKVSTLFASHPNRKDEGSVNGPWIEAPESYEVDTAAGKIELPLGSYGVSLFALRGDNAIDALEGQGKFALNGSTLMVSEPHVMAMSLDEAALDRSQAIALFTIGAGKVTLAVPPAIDVVELGKIEGGKFRAVEEIRPDYENGKLTVHIDEVQASGVLLITSASNREHAHVLMDRALR